MLGSVLLGPFLQVLNDKIYCTFPTVITEQVSEEKKVEYILWKMLRIVRIFLMGSYKDLEFFFFCPLIRTDKVGLLAVVGLYSLLGWQHGKKKSLSDKLIVTLIIVWRARNNAISIWLMKVPQSKTDVHSPSQIHTEGVWASQSYFCAKNFPE